MALTLTDIYNKLTWQNSPEHTTPVNADNLNHIENGIKNNNAGLRAAEQAINQNTTDIASLQTSVSSISTDLTELREEIPKMANPNLDYAHPLHDFSTGALSYTAAKDCYLIGSLSCGTQSGAPVITIDNVPIYTGNLWTENQRSNVIFPTHDRKILSGSTVTLNISQPLKIYQTID